MFRFDLASLIVSIPAILLALSFHEFAHGYAAYLLGDPTPKQQGRLTLNPLAHLDPLGTIMMLVARFGWARPVPVNPFYFRGDRARGMMLVSLAGPAANILIAFVGVLLYNFLGVHLGTVLGPRNLIFIFLINLIYINIYLALFNLIPLPPLDGSKILQGLLPRRYYHVFYKLESYGPIILILLILTRITGRIIMPLAQALIDIMDQIGYFIATLF